jgi:hypothetical protein
MGIGGLPFCAPGRALRKCVRQRTSPPATQEQHWRVADAKSARPDAAIEGAPHMNATQIALSATLVAGGTVSPAQTVPAEQWTGPAVSTVGGAVVRADVVAALNIFLAQHRAAPEAWAGTAASAGVDVGDLQRAEVKADTTMAIRAGLTGYATRNEYNPGSAEAQRRNARYIRLRFGPEYTDEVSRLQGAAHRIAAAPAGTPADAIGK